VNPAANTPLEDSAKRLELTQQQHLAQQQNQTIDDQTRGPKVA
jgi:hypothetical protein